MLTQKPGINIGDVDPLSFRQTYLFEEMKNVVYVLSKDGTPLMPTERHGKVRRMLKGWQS
ncbi:Hypothetical protein DEACI_2876 [Acididesulfobacillus acetoxydans]|uniref:Uncharacterized protein n=1 Tax=Acididesulfobacillus acetoxydans TaxID=1561005 RepID=A0A8S0VXR5_9FIRM|nr:Hypothetical protein DEACI_2876 [Acididesulfobacillus acetoxydans]CEJ08759.1 Hypothetical protein DEACI_3239 [Acididesulfobacillus acetoxydans]